MNSKTLSNLRIAEINKLDMKIEDGKVVAFRARVTISLEPSASSASNGITPMINERAKPSNAFSLAIGSPAFPANACKPVGLRSNNKSS